MKKRVLLIGSSFPPVNAVAVHRIAGLCRHLMASGWLVTVITRQPEVGIPTDERLLEQIPKDLRVIRAQAPHLSAVVSRVFRAFLRLYRSVSRTRVESGQTKASDAPAQPARRSNGPAWQIVDWLSWWLQVPDEASGWLLPAVQAGMGEARRERPDVIFSTAPQWTSHLIGLVLSKLLRVPWVADFRDPWCDSSFREVPYAAHRRFSRRLETWVVRRATKVTCATDGIRRRLAAAYPERARDMRTILNGYDPELLNSVGPVRLDSGRCVLLHSGTFYGPRSPRPLLEALRELRRGDASVPDRLVVVLLGEPTYEGQPLERMAAEYTVASFVRVIPRVPHREALAVLKGSDVAMLFGQGGEAEFRPVTAKVYEYIGAGKPVLAIGAGPEVLEILKKGGCRVWEAEAMDLDGIVLALRDIVAEHARGSLGTGDGAAARLRFTQDRMAAELTRILEGAIEHGFQIRGRSRTS